jgi:hypothetical protein
VTLMNHKNVPWLVLAAVLVLVGLSVGGVSVTPVVYPLILLACPLMMFWMMRGMNSGDGGGNNDHDHSSPHSDSTSS